MQLILAAIYLAACALVAVLGRGRMVGFWGFLVLAVLLSPLPVLALLLLTLPRRARAVEV